MQLIDLVRLANFSIRRPPHETDQGRLLDWIAEAHAEAQAHIESLGRAERDAFADRMRRIVARHSCGPDQIRRRGHVIADVGRGWDRAQLYDPRRHPHGLGTAARTRLFDEAVSAYFVAEYESETTPPADLIHVTCTGYLSPSGAQKLVAERGWGGVTRVTHAYHMGCYAAFPAIRLALGALALPPEHASGAAPRVDVVHTELCSLHFDPAAHAPGQLVVQSLFADGFIRYSVVGGRGPGLRVLALDERILPQSVGAMSWVLGDHGMSMTLSRDVPARVGASVRQVVLDLFRRAQLDPGPHLKRAIFAVHPGGPKIIDGVAVALELAEPQVRASREVLAAYGNMSSATLPHVWARLLDDPDVPVGTPIVSLAFGPGLTVCGGLFRKQ